MRFLLLFLDGVGLGVNDPDINPLAGAKMPNLLNLLDGQRLVAETAPFEGSRANLLALDACLGVNGLPESATGQAVLLTGINVPAAIGYHYGPKPNPAVAEFLRNGNLFNSLQTAGHRVTLLNAYPPRYFEAIQSGRRLYSAIPLAASNAGIPLKTTADLYAGQALSVDFTGQGWHTQLGFIDTPILTPHQAGKRMAELAMAHDFALLDHWPTDYAGHGQNMAQACELLEIIDGVLGGLVDSWGYEDGLILITSDHGNLEDLSTRRHTLNPVPALVIGARELRNAFINSLVNLTHVAPAIQRFLATG